MGGLVSSVTVMLAFLLVTIISQHYVRAIDSDARTLGTNAMPSIDRLAAARGALQRSAISARRLARGVASSQAAEQATLATARAQLDREMRGYLEQPFFPGEQHRAELAVKDVGAYQALLDELMRTLRSGDAAAAHELMLMKVSPASERADEDLEGLVRLNADQGILRSGNILRTRVRAMQLSYLLHVLAGALVLLVLWIALRVRRSHERLLEAQARLEAERKELAEQRAAELDLFAARVAHDLKNPLGTVAISVELAQRQLEQPEKARASLGRTSRAIATMQKIIDGLLALARATGETPGASESADLGDAIQSTVAALAPEAERAGVTISVESGPAASVACDAGALLSVVGNLLGNAVKYVVAAPAESRRVQVRVIDKREEMRVEIDDTGPGIADEEQQRIFQPYVRGRGAAQPGIGLGLATVKRIVEAHGGKIGVRSVVGRGSCFWFELPRARPSTTDCSSE